MNTEKKAKNNNNPIIITLITHPLRLVFLSEATFTVEDVIKNVAPKGATS